MRWIWTYLRTAGDNFAYVAPGLYRSATPSPENLALWQRKYGIKTWIDLRDVDDWDGNERTVTDKHRNYDDQIATCRRLGIERVWLPCSDRLPMPEETIQKFLAILADKSKGVILFGCAGNRHRAGLLCCMFRMRVQGWSEKEAMKEAHKRGYYRFGHERFDDRFKELIAQAEAARK